MDKLDLAANENTITLEKMDRHNHPVYQALKKRSKFFCTAKWNELYLYLNHGLSNSCHHPIPHEIDIESAKENPATLHNTAHKLEQQQLMCDGERPEECHMCWHIEDADPKAISDRLHKSVIEDIHNLEPDENHLPKMIEVVFDNTCNLHCSYCDGGQSSQWASKIRNNPLELTTDYRQLYSNVPIKPGSTVDELNEIFLRWFPEVQQNLELIKVSGGEPLLSKNFWNFIELIDNQDLDVAINSNLSVDTALVDKLISYEHKFKSLRISASIDATGMIAESARAGLDYKLFLHNLKHFLNNSNGSVKLQATVNIFNIWGFTDLLDLQLELREQYGDRIQDIYITIVRHPEFQSIKLLPDRFSKNIAWAIDTWLHNSGNRYISQREHDRINKVRSYLLNKPEGLKDIESKALEQDLRDFVIWYNQPVPVGMQAWLNV